MGSASAIASHDGNGTIASAIAPDDGNDGIASVIATDGGNDIIIGDGNARDEAFGRLLASSGWIPDANDDSGRPWWNGLLDDEGCLADGDDGNANDWRHAIPGMLFGIDLRGGAIRSMMNGRHETAPTLKAANGLVVRLMRTMMERCVALQKANVDDIHLVDPFVRDVTVMVDDVKQLASDGSAFNGIMCMHRIGKAVGFHVILGCSDADWLAGVLEREAFQPYSIAA